MTMATTHKNPVVAAWLSDLERALDGKDPHERAETLVTIREHLDQALTDATTPQDVDEILRRLGSVESIAADVAPNEPPATATPSPWSALALGLALLSVLLLLPLPFVAAPLALIALTLSVLALRRPGGRRTAELIAVTLATVTLVAAAVMVLGMVDPSHTPAPTPGPVTTVTP